MVQCFVLKVIFLKHLPNKRYFNGKWNLKKYNNHMHLSDVILTMQTTSSKQITAEKFTIAFVLV